jgi:hypothetical protein
METPTRRKEEFYCSECRKYFLTYLRTNYNGQFTIRCPNTACAHKHHRVIVNGLVTDTRCNDKAGLVAVIVGLKATLRDTPWHDDPHFRRQQIKAVQ